MTPEEQMMLEEQMMAEEGGAPMDEAPMGGGDLAQQNNQMLQEIGQMVQQIGQMLSEQMGGALEEAEAVGVEEGAMMEDEALRQEAMARLAQQG